MPSLFLSCCLSSPSAYFLTLSLSPEPDELLPGEPLEDVGDPGDDDAVSPLIGMPRLLEM